MSGTCSYCLGIRLVGWSGAGPILCPSCSNGQDAFTVITQAWREQRALAVALTAERDLMMTAAQIGVAQCAQVQDALRRVLPMAEAWFRREFDGLCHHEPGECHCDREAHARTDINIALAALGKKAP